MHPFVQRCLPDVSGVNCGLERSMARPGGEQDQAHSPGQIFRGAPGQADSQTIAMRAARALVRERRWARLAAKF